MRPLSTHVILAGLVTCLLAASAFAAGPRTPVQVSTNAQDGNNYIPRGGATAVSASGRQLVVWTQDDRSHTDAVWGRIVDAEGAPVGAPFQISDGPRSAVSPAVAARGRRDEFLVVWNQSPAIVARRIDGEGNVRGDEFLVAADGQRPAMAYGGKRREFLVVWDNFAAGVSRVYGARLAAGSSTAPEPFSVSPRGSRFFHNTADVAYDSRTGRYLVAWTKVSRNPRSAQPFVRRLPAAPGGAPGPVRRLTRSESDAGGGVHLAYSVAAREYLAVWRGSLMRRVTASGEPYGRDPAVGRGTSLDHVFPLDVVSLPAGGYMLLITANRQVDVYNDGVYARRVGRDLEFGPVRPVSSRDEDMGASGGALAYSRAQGRARAVWVEGIEPHPNAIGPRPAWEVFTRGL